MVTVVTADSFRDMIDERRRGQRSFAVVDTRPAESYDGWRVADAHHYFYKPYHEFDREDFERETGLSPSDHVVTMCAKGKASLDLAEKLAAAGYDEVTVVEDGMRGWSAVYDRVHVPLANAGDRPLDVVQIQRRAKGCLGYLVVGGAAGDMTGADGSGREAVAIDVSRHGGEWRAAAAELDSTIVGVLDTHVHADHLSGGRALADELDVPYYLPAAARKREVAYGFEPLERNETLDVGGVDVKALATPGHTEDMASYLVGRSAVLTGDTLFTGGVGRTELQFAADGNGDASGGATGTASDGSTGAASDGSTDAETAGSTTGAEQLYDSLHATLLAEPDDVVVLPGHFSVANDGGTGEVVPGEPVSTTVGNARTGIDVLSLEREAFVERITATLPEKPPNYGSVIAANRGVESPPDETAAIELELGPNRCAAEPAPGPGGDDD